MKRSASSSRRSREKYDLVRDALFHTGVVKSEWNEGISRWVISTDRGDEIRAQYLILAVGILNLMKLPVIPGMEDVPGQVVPLRALGLRVHRRQPGREPRQPGRQGRGRHRNRCQRDPVRSRRWPNRRSTCTCSSGRRRRSACAATARRARSSRTPCIRVGSRSAWRTSQATMIGRPVERDLIDDGWTHHMAKVANPAVSPEMSVEEIMQVVEEFDFAVMEEHRSRIEQTVSDPAIGRDPQAVLPVPLQAAVLPRRVSARVQPAERGPRRLPRRHRTGHRARSGRERARRTSSTASSTPPASRPS